MTDPRDERSPQQGGWATPAEGRWEGGTEPPTWSSLSPDAQGLVTGVVQDRAGNVRMVAWLSKASYAKTLETGLVTFWSRSRERLWTKGEESGNTLRLLDVRADCDGDTLLLTVDPAGPTCHTGAETCFDPTEEIPPQGGWAPLGEAGQGDAASSEIPPQGGWAPPAEGRWEGGTEPPTWSSLSPDARGLVTGVVQDRAGNVRMVAWLSEASYAKTLETGLVTFWSRSRKRLWTKGEESGNVLRLLDVKADCDGDTLLLTVDPAGPTCHTGADTCFGPTEEIPPQGGWAPLGSAEWEGGAEPPAQNRFAFLDTLWATIESRAQDRPEGSYTTQLLDGGPDQVGRKVVEEATEVLIAAKNHEAGADDDERLAEEAADLVYHLLVALAERGVDPALVTEELRARHG